VHALFQELDRRTASAEAANRRRRPRSDGDGDGGGQYDDYDNSPAGGGASSFHYAVHCSMLQIYNEQLHDLLSPAALNGQGEALRIRESHASADGGQELFVSGLASFRVGAVGDVLALLRHGARARAVRATEYNEVCADPPKGPRCAQQLKRPPLFF
jgi:hypothetical protein